MASRLRRVILRSAVRLQDISNEWQCFGAAGPEPGSLAACLGVAAPLEIDGVTNSRAATPWGCPLPMLRAYC